VGERRGGFRDQEDGGRRGDCFGRGRGVRGADWSWERGQLRTNESWKIINVT
jgi:hypothetical protein